MNVIHIQKLTKSFGTTQALKGIDLTVKQGEVHGFIGPNGAGKSTTIRILLGILQKTSGEITLFGGDPWQDAVKLHRRLVYVPVMLLYGQIYQEVKSSTFLGGCMEDLTFLEKNNCWNAFSLIQPKRAEPIPKEIGRSSFGGSLFL
ncbi:ATP-binding cassette domain-containing protein [Methanosarcina horonobensis]|uniref:ATP-binding cassette domain-containing protein n=1 Tax=Methanosarcina horonobensis TaxID=418008 RepID=UPI000A4D69D9|nr:ATP-binding cassette domain-containing protein [Methanosarcina horonobensis]